MPTGDIPQISNAAYFSNSYDGSFTSAGTGVAALEGAMLHRRVRPHNTYDALIERINALEESETISTEQMTMNSQKRIVQIFIADPDINVPLDASLLYQSEKPFVTDLNDQELFFELPIKTILDTHNAKRTLLLDKAATSKSGKDVKLEPIKVRELRMTVVDIAKF